MFRLSYNANGLRTVPLDVAIRAVADAGYQGIELSLHPRHIDPFGFRPKDADRVRRLLDENGIVACCLATGADTLLSAERFEPSLVTGDEAGRDVRLTLIRRSIDFARWLGVPVINFASGIRNPEVSEVDAQRWLLDGLKRCVEYADGDVILALEPEPGFFVQTNGEACALIAEIGSPQFGLAQDLGHCRVVEEDYLGSVAASLDATRIIQVEDIKGRHHYHEIPGDGDIDFRSFFDICATGGYDGFYSVELYNHADDFRTALKRSIEHLRAQQHVPTAS